MSFFWGMVFMVQIISVTYHAHLHQWGWVAGGFAMMLYAAINDLIDAIKKK